MTDEMRPSPGTNPDPEQRLDAEELALRLLSDQAAPADLLREVEDRLAAGDEPLRNELERLSPVFEALLEAESIEPPAHVRALVMNAIALPALEDASLQQDAGLIPLQDSRHSSWIALTARARAIGTDALSGVQDAGVFVERAFGGSWKRVGLPGVLVKTLFEDRAADRRTQLVRCEPGAYIPEHQHGGIEELLVLDGNLRVGDVLLGPGDYFRAMPGAEHGEVRSPNGCVCLFFTSYGTLSPTTRGVMGLRVLREYARRLFGKR